MSDRSPRGDSVDEAISEHFDEPANCKRMRVRSNLVNQQA